MSEDPQQPLTRRDIHRSPARSQRSPQPLVATTRRQLRDAEQARTVQARTVQARTVQAPAGAGASPGTAFEKAAPRPRSHHALAKATTVVVLSGALALSGFSLQEAQTADAADALQAAEVAERVSAATRLARISQASTTRLTAHGEAYAASRRTAALAAAQDAMETTETALLTAGPVVDGDELTPLASAVASLEAMMDEGGPVPAAVAAAPSPAPTVDARAQAVDRTTRANGVGREPLADAVGDAVEPAPLVTPAGDLAAEVLTAPTEVVQDSARLTALAAEVTALAAEVQATADSRLAEAQARALAERAAVARAAEIERKVEIAEGAENGAIPAGALCAPSFAPDELLRCDAADALERLNEAYRADTGADLDVISSYRSYSSQVATRRSRGWLAAAPGTSNHGLAVAVDFADIGGIGNFRTAKYRWLDQNAADYGWFHPSFMEPGGGGPQEPWHWEYGQLD